MSFEYTASRAMYTAAVAAVSEGFEDQPADTWPDVLREVAANLTRLAGYCEAAARRAHPGVVHESLNQTLMVADDLTVDWPVDSLANHGEGVDTAADAAFWAEVEEPF